MYNALPVTHETVTRDRHVTSAHPFYDPERNAVLAGPSAALAASAFGLPVEPEPVEEDEASVAAAAVKTQKMTRIVGRGRRRRRRL